MKMRGPFGVPFATRTMEKMMQDEITLDSATDNFDANPCRETADTLLSVAAEYLEDDMISDDSYNAIVERTKAFVS